MRIRPLFRLLRLAPLAVVAYIIYREAQQRQGGWGKTSEPAPGPAAEPEQPPDA